MLKPITEQEKAAFTLKAQLERSIQELLAEAYDAGYTGYLDIWPEMDHGRKQVIMTVKSGKVLSSTSPMSDENAIRYHVAQGKGCKRIK